MHHARMVRRLFSYIGEGGHVPHEWFAAEVARLDNMSGDIEALADRLAGIRSWAYIAHRADWLKEPAKWAERTREVEARLSRRAARAADPALRRPPHRGSRSRHRRARRRCLAGDRRRRRRGQRRPGADRPSHRLRVPGRSRRHGSPTSACCLPPPSAALATSSTAARARWSKRPTRPSRWSSRKAAASPSPGRAMSSHGSRPAARCSSRRFARRARSTVCRRRRRAALRARLERWLDAQVDRHLRAAEDACRRGNRSRELAGRPRACRDARRCRRRAAAQGGARRHRPSRAGRPPGAPPAARPPRPARRLRRPLLKPAAQYWRAALARRAHRASRCPRCPPPALRRSRAMPTRAARRSPTAGSGATGFESTLPTGSRAMRARFARPAATIRSMRRWLPRSGLTRRRFAG